jgi:hypothetical protein
MRAHVRSEIHSYLDQPRLAPAGSAEISIESLKERIAIAKRQLDDQE